MKPRNRQNVLHPHPPKFVAERSVFDIACTQRPQKGGDARPLEVLI